jgi:hypothetical protein
MEFALLNRLTAKPGRRNRVVEMRPFVEQCMPLLEGMPEQIRVRPVGGKVPGG